MEKILAHDCDGEDVEEWRVLRFPFSDTIDNWEEELNVDPRFYCAIKSNNNQDYLISVYDDYHSQAIRKYEKISQQEQIPTIIKNIEEAENYEVAFDGITKRCWYYDRDRSALKAKLQALVKDKELTDTEEER